MSSPKCTLAVFLCQDTGRSVLTGRTPLQGIHGISPWSGWNTCHDPSSQRLTLTDVLTKCLLVFVGKSCIIWPFTDTVLSLLTFLSYRLQSMVRISIVDGMFLHAGVGSSGSTPKSLQYLGMNTSFKYLVASRIPVILLSLNSKDQSILERPINLLCPSSCFKVNLQI